MRPGCGFRMVLDRENRQSLMTEPGDGLVVEIYMGDLDLGRQGIGGDSEAVVM